MDNNYKGLVIDKTKYSISEFARMLNMNRNSLRKELKEYNLYERGKPLRYGSVQFFLKRIGLNYYDKFMDIMVYHDV
jgi:hypothetical protein